MKPKTTFQTLSFAIGLTWAFSLWAQADISISNEDPLHSYLVQAFSATNAKTRPSFNHIGVQGLPQDQHYLVTAVLEGYPAFEAGINRGDRITSVNGMPFNIITAFNEQSQGTVQIEYLRGSQRTTVDVSPVFENLYDSYRTATVDSVQEFSAGNKVIGYLRLWALSRNSADLNTFLQLMKQLDHCDGLILDLRNSYGFFDDTHKNVLLPNADGVNHFEKSIVILFDQTTSSGALEIIRAAGRLERIVVLGPEPFLDINPELQIPYPFEQTSRSDPQFEAALNRLLGTI